jgi:hypothetical protein
LNKDNSPLQTHHSEQLQQTTLSLSLSLSTQTEKKLLKNFLFEKAVAELLITMRFKKNPSLPTLEKQKF